MSRSAFSVYGKPSDEAVLIISALTDEQCARAFEGMPREEAVYELTRQRLGAEQAPASTVVETMDCASARYAAKVATIWKPLFIGTLVLMPILLMLLGIKINSLNDASSTENGLVYYLSLFLLFLFVSLIPASIFFLRMWRKQVREALIEWAVDREGQLARGIPNLHAPWHGPGALSTIVLLILSPAAGMALAHIPLTSLTPSFTLTTSAIL